MEISGEMKSKLGKWRGVQKAPKYKWNLGDGDMDRRGATPSAPMKKKREERLCIAQSTPKSLLLEVLGCDMEKRSLQQWLLR